MKYKILLAEDEDALGQIVKESLESKNYQVDWAINGKKALELFEKNDYHLIILDVMMPIMDGFTCAKTIRKTNKDVTIFFLTAKSQTDDVVKGFEIGCHDYIKKPFSLLELFARIEAVLKRIHSNLETKIDFGKFAFDENSNLLSFENKQYKLSHKEAQLLLMLIQEKNQLVDRAIILQKIWGSTDYFAGRSLDVYITRLRKILTEDTTIEIVNLRGVGYKMVV